MNRKARVALSSVSTIACVLLLLGCAATNKTEEATATNKTEEATERPAAKPQLVEATRVAAPVPFSAARFATGGVEGYVGADDYTFDLGFTVLTGEASSSIANSAPGEAEVSWQWKGVFSATNTTEGRNSSWSYLNGLTAYGLWPNDSVLCPDVSVRSGIFATNPSSLDIDGVTYCPVRISGVQSSSELGIDQTKWSDISGQETYTVPEDVADAIVSELTDGPSIVAWASAGLDNCGSDTFRGVLWTSSPGSACNSMGSYFGFPEDVSQSTEAAMSLIAKISDASQDPDVCPLPVAPLQLQQGMLADNIQSQEWGHSFLEEPVDSSDPFDYRGFSCNDGGMQVSFIDTSNIDDVFSFLANDSYSQWETITEDMPVGGGTLVLTPGTINPESGESYDIVRFAWTKDNLLVRGKLVGSDMAHVAAWVKVNLGQILPQ